MAISSGTVAAIVVVVVLDLFAILFGLSFVRARRAARAQEELAPGRPAPAPERTRKAPKPMSRREFFRKSLVVSFSVFAAQFGGATIAFLWPNLRGGFGSIVNAGNIDDIRAEIAETGQPFYFGAGRFYIVPYSASGVDEGTGTDYVTAGVTTQGLMTLYQKCVHLGCRVPFCQQSQWFECPCHGSKYNSAGEYKLGPAPRGMDRFAIQVDDAGNVLVDTTQVVIGPPRGTDTTGRPQAGPFCVAAG
jgi:cytochrome b6-f complex iron-sulfur subunit